MSDKKSKKAIDKNENPIEESNKDISIAKLKLVKCKYGDEL